MLSVGQKRQDKYENNFMIYMIFMDFRVLLTGKVSTIQPPRFVIAGGEKVSNARGLRRDATQLTVSGVWT